MFFPLSPPSTCPPAITKNGALFLVFHLLDDGRGVINDGYARSAKKKNVGVYSGGLVFIGGENRRHRLGVSS